MMNQRRKVNQQRIKFQRRRWVDLVMKMTIVTMPVGRIIARVLAHNAV